MPWVIPSIVSGTIWKWALNDQFGIINHLLMRWGIINKPLLFFSTSAAARMSVIMTGTWKTFPFMSIVLLAGLQSVPKELYESAHIDGANFFRRFLSITMPMIKGPSIIVTTLQFIWTFNNFENIYLFTRGGPANSTFVMSILTYYTAFYRNNLGYAAALAVVMLIVLMVLSLIYMRIIKSKEI
jgi:multiple sugar transport system permease protein